MFALVFLGNLVVWGVAVDVPFAPGVILDPCEGCAVKLLEDFDGDGDLDALVSCSEDFTLRLRLYNGAGYDDVVLFTTYASQPTLSGDVNNDGAQDILAMEHRELLWLVNDGQVPPGFSTVQVESDYPTGPHAVGDVDQDGDLDVVSGLGSYAPELGWYSQPMDLNQPWPRHWLDSQDQMIDVATGDFNGDRLTDLAALWRNSHDHTYHMRWYESDGAPVPTFTSHDVTSDGGRARFMETVDMDGDGALDLILASEEVVAWIQNDVGDGTAWTVRPICEHITIPTGFAVGDIDQDGDADCIIAGSLDGKVAWYEFIDVATAPFPEHSLTTEDNNLVGARWVEALDWEGDGDLDVVGYGYDGLTLYENLTTRILTLSPDFDDLNGDGINQPGEPGMTSVSVGNPFPHDMVNTVVSIADASENIHFRQPSLAVGTLSPAQTGPLVFPFMIDQGALRGSPVTAEIRIFWDGGSRIVPLVPEWIGEYRTGPLRAEDTVGGTIPDNGPAGLVREVTISEPMGAVALGMSVGLDITHSHRGDLAVYLTGPDGVSIPVFVGDPLDGGQSLVDRFPISQWIGAPGIGTYTLTVIDRAPEDTGVLTGWDVELFGEWYSISPWSDQWVNRWLLDTLLGRHADSLALDFNSDGLVDVADLVGRMP